MTEVQEEPAHHYTGCPSEWQARDQEADEALLFGDQAVGSQLIGSQNTLFPPIFKKCKTPAAPT